MIVRNERKRGRSSLCPALYIQPRTRICMRFGTIEIASECDLREPFILFFFRELILVASRESNGSNNSALIRT